MTKELEKVAEEFDRTGVIGVGNEHLAESLKKESARKGDSYRDSEV